MRWRTWRTRFEIFSKMSESNEHRSLVFGVRDALRALYPRSEAVIDILHFPGARIPPIIDGFRPDLFIDDEEVTVIAEAKTDNDIDRVHTYGQIMSFIGYLERSRSKDRLFVLAVTGRRADFARTTLRFVCHETEPWRTQVAVFDEHDLWLLNGNDFTWTIFDAPENREL